MTPPPSPPVTIELSAVITTVTDEVPRILTVRGPGATRDGLPSGPLDPNAHRTLERALRAWVREQSGIDVGYVEQLYTFGDRDRDPRAFSAGVRVVSVAYLALVRESDLGGTHQPRWRDVYDCFPWEDWRPGRPEMLDQVIIPALRRWIDAASDRGARLARQERAAVTFALSEAATWDNDRVLDRYELLYELGLVDEAHTDRAITGGAPPLNEGVSLGKPMQLDHRRIFASALGRLRGKIRYRPVVFELMPTTFTLTALQRLVEALAGGQLHKQNFRRLLDRAGLVEGTGEMDHNTGGRPAEMFAFRRGALRERPAPGVGLPGLKR